MYQLVYVVRRGRFNFKFCIVQSDMREGNVMGSQRVFQLMAHFIYDPAARVVNGRNSLKLE